MKLRTLDDFKWKGKRVLVRSDLNSPIKNRKVEDNDRIVESAKTLKELARKGARVVVLSHQARPGKKDFRGLAEHAKLLNKYVKVKFISDTIGRKALKAIESLKDGEVLLLENVRMLKEEFKPSVRNKLVKKLAPLFDVYVNDAFSVSHREHTSVVSFPKVLPSCVGRLMESELKHLGELKLRNCLYVLGGAKMSEVVTIVDKVSKPPAQKVLASGLFALLCLEAKGEHLGETEKDLKKDGAHLCEVRHLRKNVVFPKDFAVKVNGKRKNISIDDFPTKHTVLDIGDKTIHEYVKEIKKAKCIFMKGSAGFVEDKKFSKGTKKLLAAIADSKAFTVIGGGHTTTTLKEMGINKKKFNYVSLSGGALVYYIAGKKLPGLEALKRKKKGKRK